MKLIGSGVLRVFLSVIAFTLTAFSYVPAQATEKVLYTVPGGSDGGSPYAGLTPDSKGNLYGTAVTGGAGFSGIVFELTPNSNGSWTEQVLYNFTGFMGTTDGAEPYGGVTFDGEGNLYGTTAFAGPNENGTIFELSPGLNGTWSEKVLYGFAAGSDGGTPYFGVALDSAGDLYGTTTSGGAEGFGTVFQLAPSASGAWTKKILHNFTGADDGNQPFSRLVFDAVGNLYGSTFYGGLHDYGVVFQLTPESNGMWTEKVVHAFTGGAGGLGSIGGLAFDHGGNLFAEASYSVLEFSPSSGGTWTVKDVHDFTGGSDGAWAEGGLALDNAGNLYGVSNTGGKHRGTVFELTPSTNGTWTEKILHSFTGGSDGNFPEFNYLYVDANGNIYGTTPLGGASGLGVIFEVSP